MIKDIAVILRGKNESKWIIQCIESLNKQEKVSLDIFYIDNKSSDFTSELALSMGAIVSFYKEEYLPGKMLNFGIKYAENYGQYKSFLFLSSHCIIQDPLSLYYLFTNLDIPNKIRSCFGRQVPAQFSSLSAIRDLVELYPSYTSLDGTTMRLNNAFSLISFEAIKENYFDETVTNIEDFIWSIQEIKKGYAIKYVPQASVMHSHGPHHEENELRLRKTAKTLKLNWDMFDFKPAKTELDKSKILAIFSSNQVKEQTDQVLINFLKRWSKKNNFEMVILFKEDKKDNFYTFSLRDKIKSYLLANEFLKVKYEYFLIFDSTFDFDFEIPPISIYLDCISNCFPTSITPAFLSYSQIFKNSDFKIERIDCGDLPKENNPGVFIGKRGNGWITHISYFLNEEKNEDNAIIYKDSNKWYFKHTIENN